MTCVVLNRKIALQFCLKLNFVIWIDSLDQLWSVGVLILPQQCCQSSYSPNIYSTKKKKTLCRFILDFNALPACESVFQGAVDTTGPSCKPGGGSSIMSGSRSQVMEKYFLKKRLAVGSL